MKDSLFLWKLLEKEVKMKIKRIWFADNRIYGETEDGKVLWQSLLYYKRLLNATPEQRANYEMDVNGSKKPSKERENAIMQEIKNVAGEL